MYHLITNPTNARSPYTPCGSLDFRYVGAQLELDMYHLITNPTTVHPMSQPGLSRCGRATCIVYVSPHENPTIVRYPYAPYHNLAYWCGRAAYGEEAHRTYTKPTCARTDGATQYNINTFTDLTMRVPSNKMQYSLS